MPGPPTGRLRLFAQPSGSTRWVPARRRRPRVAVASGTGWHRLQLARTSRGRAPLLRLPTVLAGLDYTTVDWVQSLLDRPARTALAARTPAPDPVPAD